MLIPFLLIPSAYAEVGKNFDTEELGNGQTQWTSHYERIFDGTNWQNYILTNDGNQIRFKSAGIDFSFDKINCDFKLYNPISNALVINSYQFDISIDGVNKVKSICDVVNFISSADTISFKIDRGEFQTFYDLTPTSGMEWTHEITNKEGKNSTFAITETCENCIPVSVNGNLIDFGSYILDTKNIKIDPITNLDIGHHTVKETKSDKGNYVIVFEKEISDNEKLVIDPVFSSNNPVIDGWIQDSVDDGDCLDGTTKDIADAVLYPHSYAAASPNDCINSFLQWDITSIPDTSTIQDTHFLFEISSVPGPADNCDYMPMTVNVTSATNAQIIADTMDGTPYVDNSAICTTAANDKDLDLGVAADSFIENTALAQDRFALGIKANEEPTGGGANDLSMRHASEEDGGATPKPTLSITYVAFSPDAVNDLVAIDIRPTAVDLDWSQPNLNGGVLSGYQINFTTPWSSNVATIITNNTGSATTSKTVSSLTGSTQYSFRIGIWETEQGSKNMTGNVLNITTDFDPTGAFTVGQFNITQTGTDSRPMVFERDDINDTALFLNVTYSDTVDLACDFYYKFGNNNQTYVTFTNTSAGAGRVESPILFLDVDNEIIDVNCFDENGSNATGRYLITQTSFPLVEYINAWRGGEFGTSGDFGVLDFVTLIAIIISMVGMNRVNPSVGLVFSIFIIGGLAVFGIIEWPTIMTASIVLIAMFIIGSTKKDD